MRKTFMLGTLIALFGIGALAQAKDVTATEQKSAAEATPQPDTPAVRDQTARERRSEEHEHHDKTRERHDDDREHGRRH
jgi:hypothetical protein